jgi:hypothetical protein
MKNTSSYSIKNAGSIKRIIVSEPINKSGTILRHRTLDNNIFDVLFIRKNINAPQHGAGECLLYDLEKSGIYISSPNMEPSVKSGYKNMIESTYEKYFLLYKPLEYIRKNIGDMEANSIFKWSLWKHGEPLPKEDGIKLISRCLESLSYYYKTSYNKDPRELI